jgi:low temperature requirement protein LtrA
MSEPVAPASLLRSRSSHDHVRVTYVELFFDLIFVFAVTQLSHLGGLGLLAAIAALSPMMTLLLLGVSTTAVLIIVAAWETASLRSAQRLA